MKMAVLLKIKSSFEQLLSEICARRPRENNEKVCIYCLEPRSNRYKFECKHCGCTDFYVFDYQNSSFQILTVCNV